MIYSLRSDTTPYGTSTDFRTVRAVRTVLPLHPSYSNRAMGKNILSVDNDAQYTLRTHVLTEREMIYGPYELYGP